MTSRWQGVIEALESLSKTFVDVNKKVALDNVDLKARADRAAFDIKLMGGRLDGDERDSSKTDSSS
jgi:hypothetical protein